MRFVKEVLTGSSFSRIAFNLGVLSGILALVDFVMSILYINGRKATLLDDSDYVVQAFEVLYMSSAFFSGLQFLTCVFFVYGSMANKPRWFLPWLVVYSTSFLFYMGVFLGASAAILLGGQAPTSFEVLLRCVISSVLNVYFLMMCFCVLPRVDGGNAASHPALQKSYYDCVLASA